MRQIKYMCHPFRGKCKLYNHPKLECVHAISHCAVEELDVYCYDERDCVCGGICRRINVAKSTSHNKRKPKRKPRASAVR
jgi:hypothetical protein